MGVILEKLQFGADDNQDMVDMRLGTLRPRMPYQNAFDLVLRLQLGCKMAARADRQAATFVQDMEGELESLEDCPPAHRGFRRSILGGNVRVYEVRARGTLVCIQFDDEIIEMEYEDGIRFHRMLHRAARRAKAWAGDTGRSRRMLGNLTDAEEDDRLGLM